MTIGSLIGALGLLLIVRAVHPIAYLAVWTVLGLAMAANLYDAAFGSLGRIFGAAARRPITALTLAGGFASTVSWPATHFLTEALGWRGTYLVYAALLAFVAAPLHAFALPRGRAEAAAANDRRACAGARLAAAWATLRPGSGGVCLLRLRALRHVGASAGDLYPLRHRCRTVVFIGALFGPAQVGARLIEFAFGRDIHPLWVARFALSALLAGFVMLALFGISTPTAAAFALMFGGANGLVTITRGAVPLALFGASGYGRLMGRLACPWLLMQAAAPLVMAFVVDRASDSAALALAAASRRARSPVFL